VVGVKKDYKPHSTNDEREKEGNPTFLGPPSQARERNHSSLGGEGPRDHGDLSRGKEVSEGVGGLDSLGGQRKKKGEILWVRGRELPVISQTRLEKRRPLSREEQIHLLGPAEERDFWVATEGERLQLPTQ